MPTRPRRLPRFAIEQPYGFFAHVAFAFDPRSHATPQATANLLVEVERKAVKAHDRHRHLKASEAGETHAWDVAAEIAIAAAREYLKSEPEFRPFPALRFVNFDQVHPTHISICPPATKVLADGTKIWRLAESEADKLRGEPHSVRYPGIERRLAEVRGGQDPGKAKLVAALARHLAVQRRMHAALAAYDADTERILIELETVRGRVLADDTAAGERLAALQDEIETIADHLRSAGGESAT